MEFTAYTPLLYLAGVAVIAAFSYFVYKAF